VEIWAEGLVFIFLRFFVRFWFYFVLFLFVFSLDPGWLKSQYLLGIFSSRGKWLRH